MISKILKFLFILLVFILLVEIIYLIKVYYFSNNKNQIKNNQVNYVRKNINEKNVTKEVQDIIFKNINEKKSKNIYIKSEIVNLIKAKIISIEKDNINIDYNSGNFVEVYNPIVKINLLILRNNNSLINDSEEKISIYLDNYELNNLEILTKDNKKLNLEDLKLDQLITIEEKFDLLNDNKWKKYTFYLEN